MAGVKGDQESWRANPSGLEASQGVTFEQLKSLRGRDFLRKSIEYYSELFVEAIRKYGVDLSDYSPERLRMIDDHFFESAGEACVREGISPEDGILWSAYHGVGSYFGIVIIRNLGGVWRFPSTLRSWLSRVLARPELLFDSWYVEVKNVKIPVFKIARWRCDGSGRVRSLAEAYEEIAAERPWSEK